MNALTFALTLRRMTALPKVLMLVARLGGRVTFVSAADGRVTLALVAPSAARHRFGSQIKRIIDVVELTECPSVDAYECRASEAAVCLG